MVAHELRNPLAPLKTASSLLSRAGSDAALLARIQGIIQRQVAHMSRLVDDLLDGSRVSAGKFRVEMDTVEMNSILRLCVETCRPATQDKQQHLDLRLPAGDLVLQGDHVRLLQIFTNLLENASKYTQRGGSIALAVRVLEQRVTVVVSDNGVGITAAALPHIFDLFVQDKSALTAENRGLGIGLAVVRDLVAAHGGSVLAKSPGRGLGSEFVVTLPRPGAALAEGG